MLTSAPESHGHYPRLAVVTGATFTVDGGLELMAAHGHDHAEGWREL